MEPGYNKRRTDPEKFGEPKKNNTGKKILIYAGVGLGIVAIAAGTYFLFFNEKETGDKEILPPLPPPPAPKTSSSYTPPKYSSSSSGSSYTPPKPPAGFPLKKGSRGALVKTLQEALIKTYGKSILPKWGADGDFGSETKNALLLKGFTEVVDEVTFNKIVNPSQGQQEPAAPNPTASLKPTLTNDVALGIASTLITKTKAKDAVGMMSALMKIKNTADYTLVNEPFKTFALDGHNQSIVNGVLSAFDDDTVKMIENDVQIPLSPDRFKVQ
jgi:hypothetical protein